MLLAENHRAINPELAIRIFMSTKHGSIHLLRRQYVYRPAIRTAESRRRPANRRLARQELLLKRQSEQLVQRSPFRLRPRSSSFKKLAGQFDLNPHRSHSAVSTSPTPPVVSPGPPHEQAD